MDFLAGDGLVRVLELTAHGVLAVRSRLQQEGTTCRRSTPPQFKPLLFVSQPGVTWALTSRLLVCVTGDCHQTRTVRSPREILPDGGASKRVSANVRQTVGREPVGALWRISQLSSLLQRFEEADLEERLTVSILSQHSALNRCSMMRTNVVSVGTFRVGMGKTSAGTEE